MHGSAFQLLFQKLGSPTELYQAYQEFLLGLFSSPVWSGGRATGKRVHWSLGEQARRHDRETFSSPGVYLWGAEEQPLYIGITRGTFSRRFSRYIWQTKSQCKLAQEHREVLVEKRLAGFPVEIREWYRSHFKGSTVRLQGAVRFAEEGIDKIWFTLLPHSVTSEIASLEPALVEVAESWNRAHGLRRLLNIEFNSKGG